jgi:N-acetylglucosamine-6-phosphate deacetylase
VPVLRAATVVTPAGLLCPGEVVVEGDRIAHVGPARGSIADRVVVPGFVDLQVNGVDDVDVAAADGDDWARLDALLAKGGTTTWCPTLVTAPLDRYAAPLGRIASAAGRPGPRPTIAGAHLEGPFLGTRPGAHPPELVIPPDLAWLAALPEIVRVVTVGVEAERSVDAVRALAARGVLVSVGHTGATYDQVGDAAAAGARLVTHGFNGMPPLRHRDPGVLGAALSDDRLAVSFIADLAHVHPAALTIALRAKGPDGSVLVTDAVAWRAERIGRIGVTFDGQVARLADGTIAGSALTMARAVSNVVRHCGIGLEHAVAAASTNPARLLGLADRGRIAAGARADLVALTTDLEHAGTWIAGERVA